MEFETISNVNANYGYSEVKKVTAPKQPARKEDSSLTNTDNSMTKSVATTAQPATVNGKANANADQQGSSQQKEHAPSEATIDDAVKKANLKMGKTRCEYSYHKETNRVSIKVINDDTDEVIREIPPEKSLDMLQKMWEMAGILVDERR